MTKNFGTAASRRVIEELEHAGYEAVFVGGAVRDYLLAKPATDIDIATSAQPQEVKAVFSNTVDLGTEHGTVLVLMNHEPIEVTTYRTEGSYTDHRRPDEVEFVRSLKEDLRRRDFTMNALALTKEGELIDLFGGERDLLHHTIRAVGNASDRFKEDALRMIRAVRFTSVLDFKIEAETFQAICDNSRQIRHISVERIKAEMDKLFSGVNPAKAYRYIKESGLSAQLPLFPGDIDKLITTTPYENPAIGWASLMVTGNFSPIQVSNAFKLSNNEKEFLANVNEAFRIRQDAFFTIDEYYRYDLQVLLTVENLFSSFHGQDSSLTETDIRQAKSSLPIQSKKDITVTGKDLMNWTGLSGGRWTGVWMKKIEKTILHNECENDPIILKEWFLHEFKRER